MSHTYAYAKKMAAEVSPASLRETKRQIYTDLHRDAASAVGDADRLLDEMMKTEDYREAVAAYAEKRPPRWSDS
jgi:enoyl-CoA hydratase/carnithine racemase